jgi:hypothetical protein
MNALYSILESKYRWLSLAGISFTAGCVGAMMMLALAWSHGVALAWLYLGLLLTLYFCVRAFLEWKSAAEASLDSAGGVRNKGRNSAR